MTFKNNIYTCLHLITANIVDIIINIVFDPSYKGMKILFQRKIVLGKKVDKSTA